MVCVTYAVWCTSDICLKFPGSNLSMICFNFIRLMSGLRGHEPHMGSSSVKCVNLGCHDIDPQKETEIQNRSAVKRSLSHADYIQRAYRLSLVFLIIKIGINSMCNCHVCMHPEV